MGEVYRVLDPDLDRRMVLKVLRRDRVDDSGSTARFLHEARLTSQLTHPGIVPVHEMGTLDDGRHYFTMREVRGRTLNEVIADTHDAYHHDDEQGFTAHFHELIDIFHKACQPVAYAHSRGIIHRDLKPSNIMVGNFGQVQILDWGLAKIIGGDDIEEPVDPVAETTPGRRLSPFDTRQGSIVGTPAYMPPEQARGQLQSLGPAADVYSLGAILFKVLDGTSPFSGRHATAIVFRVIEGINRRPGNDTGAPPQLVNLCLEAMSRAPEARPTDAAELADAVDQWRSGSHRRQEAMEMVAEADELIPRIDRLRQRARRLQRDSRRRLQQLPDDAPIDDKRPAWAMQDEAELLEREASTYRARAIQKLDAAIGHAPQLEEAHNRLATIYQHEHADAERRREHARADSLEVFVRAHNTGQFDDYLEGRGRITLSTRPPGARLEIRRYIQQNRRLAPRLNRLLGYAPLHDRELPMGSYLIEISASGRTTVDYPVYIGRSRHWTGCPDGEEQPRRIYLPFDDELDDNDVYVPAGPFWRGGDRRASNSPPRSIKWLDSFIIQKYPVSHRDYLLFVNDLARRGLNQEAQQYCPRSVGHLGNAGDAALYWRDANGQFRPRSDDPGFLDFPVCLVDWHAARAYARWYARRTDRPWRLPTADEWEKAARGVDGRFFPWGDHLDPTWCRMLRSTAEAPGPVPVDEVAGDISPFGMGGAAGNIRDWCLPDDVDNPDAIGDDTAVPFRGGCWFSPPELCRVAVREFNLPSVRSPGIGIRLAHNFPASPSG